jgi:hypothetical protein
VPRARVGNGCRSEQLLRMQVASVHKRTDTFNFRPERPHLCFREPCRSGARRLSPADSGTRAMVFNGTNPRVATRRSFSIYRQRRMVTIAFNDCR